MSARPVRARFNTWAAGQRDQPLVTGQRVITPTGITGPITGTTTSPYGRQHRVNGQWWRATELRPTAPRTEAEE